MTEAEELLYEVLQEVHKFLTKRVVSVVTYAYIAGRVRDALKHIEYRGFGCGKHTSRCDCKPYTHR